MCLNKYAPVFPGKIILTYFLKEKDMILEDE